MGRVQGELQCDRSSHGPPHDDDSLRPPAAGEADSGVDVAPLGGSEGVGAGAAAGRLAVVAIRDDQRGDTEPVEDRHGAQALRASGAAPVHLDHPDVPLTGGEQPRGAGTECGADELGAEGQMQFLGALVVPPAECGIPNDPSLRTDVSEELPLDGVGCLRQHGSEFEVALGARREQAIPASEFGVGSARQRDGLGRGIKFEDAAIGDARCRRDHLPRHSDGDPAPQREGSAEGQRDHRKGRLDDNDVLWGGGAPGLDHGVLTLVCRGDRRPSVGGGIRRRGRGDSRGHLS